MCNHILLPSLLLFTKQIFDRHLTLTIGVQHYSGPVDDKEKREPCSQEAYNFAEETKQKRKIFFQDNSSSNVFPGLLNSI